MKRKVTWYISRGLGTQNAKSIKPGKMKIRKSLATLALCAVMMLGLCIPAAASGIRVEVDGRTLPFDQPPIVVNGRTMVPLRAIFEALGAEVNWNPSTQTVSATKEGVAITLRIGDSFITRNGVRLQLDVPAQVVSGRTLVPTRAVAESFDAEVVWNASAQTVTIATAAIARTVIFEDSFINTPLNSRWLRRGEWNFDGANGLRSSRVLSQRANQWDHIPRLSLADFDFPSTYTIEFEALSASGSQNNTTIVRFLLGLNTLGGVTDFFSISTNGIYYQAESFVFASSINSGPSSYTSGNIVSAHTLSQNVFHTIRVDVDNNNRIVHIYINGQLKTSQRLSESWSTPVFGFMGSSLNEYYIRNFRISE